MHEVNSLHIDSFTPRVAHKQAWTAFPKDLNSNLVEVLEKNYKSKLGRLESFICSGRIYENEILVRVSLQKTNQLTCLNFEMSIDHDPKKYKAIDRIGLALDGIGSLLDEFFQERKHIRFHEDLPLDWVEIDVFGEKLYLRCSRVHQQLEEEADAILGLDSALVQTNRESL